MNQEGRASTNGVVVIDKPSGPSSRDVVQRVRRTLGASSAGHAGTLDPMATGVLVVALGEATKLVPYLTADSKRYRTTIRLGIETDTLDAEGKVTAEHPLSTAPSRELIERAIQIEIARPEQVPPAFSAIRVDGERAYKAARRGEEVVLPPRPVHVHSLTLVAVRGEPPEIDLEIYADKGYYVRSLARDLSATLGSCGHLTMLRRIASGSFSIDDCASMEADAADLTEHLFSLEQAARRVLPVVILTDEGSVRALHGKALSADHFSTPPLGNGPHAWFRGDGTLAAVGAGAEDGHRVMRGFTSP